MLYIDTTLINNRGGNVAATDYVLSIMNIVSFYLMLCVKLTHNYFRIISVDYNVCLPILICAVCI